MNPWVAVFLGGGAGSVLRFAFAQLFLRMETRTVFPWATVAANIMASALLAWLVLRMDVHLPGRDHWRALLAIGFCGGFSTLSTFSLENYQLLRAGLYGFALTNVLVSVGVGVLVFYLFARSS